MMKAENLEARLTALLRATQVVGSSLDLDQVLEVIVQQAAAISSAPTVRLFLLEEGTRLLRCRVGVGIAKEAEKDIVLAIGESFSGQVAATGEPLAVSDCRGDPRLRSPEHVSKWGLISYLGLPVRVGDRVMGVLVFNTKTPRVYTPDEIAYLSTFVSAAAIAIENARLFAEVKRRNEELQSLFIVTNTVTRSLDIASITRAALLTTIEVLHVDAGRLYIFDEKSNVLRLTAHHGLPPEVLRDYESYAPGQGVIGRIYQEGQPICFADITADPKHAAMARSKLGVRLGFRSAAGLPILVQGRPVGVIYVFGRTVREFSPEDLALLSAIGGQVGIAIENARLHDAAVRRGVELEGLLQATRSVMSGLDLQEILQRIVAEAARMAGVPHVTVLLVDREAQVLRVAALVGNPVPPGFGIPLGADLSGVVAQTGEVVFSPDSSKDPRNLLAERDREVGLVTYLGLPIKGREEILGVLTFETTVPRHYNEDELAYLTAFADNAAMAIQNARLYRTVQQQAAGLEARVQERTVALEEALRAKAEFLAKMSHELRTPLNFILGFTDLLEQGIGGVLTPKQAQFVNRIRTGGKHLLGLVQDILELSLVEAGKRGLRLERIPLAPLVQEVLDIFGTQAAQKRLSVVTSLEPALCVVVERRKLHQVLSNLVGNAMKFTPEGGTITVTARIVECRLPIADVPEESQIANRKSKMVEISVKDTGIGIPAADLERVFRGFEQLDGSTTRQYGGAGIGLSLVRTLVELHGGQVWAESAGPGAGTRFVVHLPLLPDPSPKRIVVVEDDAASAEALAALLRTAGYGVEPAATGTEGLMAIQANPPDLVVLDIGLPDMDGREVLQRIRAEERTHALPVLVLTGLGQDRGEEALALGADEFLAKPISANVLTRIVGELLTGGVRKPQDVFAVPKIEGPRNRGTAG